MDPGGGVEWVGVTETSDEYRGLVRPFSIANGCNAFVDAARIQKSSDAKKTMTAEAKAAWFAKVHTPAARAKTKQTVQSYSEERKAEIAENVKKGKANSEAFKNRPKPIKQWKARELDF